MKYIILTLFLLCLVSLVSAEPDGYLIIPSINLFKSVEVVLDSDTSLYSHFYDLTELEYGVGYLQYTTWGSMTAGRTILVGHTPGAFEHTDELRIGDEIILSMDDNYRSFTIFEMYITHKSDNTLFEVAPDSYEIVLVTCIDEDLRLIIQAK